MELGAGRWLVNPSQVRGGRPDAYNSGPEEIEFRGTTNGSAELVAVSDAKAALAFVNAVLRHLRHPA